MIRFVKYQGTGNDFIMIDNRDMMFNPNSSAVQRLCDRRFGIGADGLILLQLSNAADFRMVYFNADGNESSMCGNGGRCLARFARSLEFCGDEGTFDAIDGLHEFSISPDGSVKLKMSDVPDIEQDGEAMIMDTGSPHYVIRMNDINEVDLVPAAREIRYNDRFRQKGINVNYMEEKSGKHYMRTYERGVEDETLSCGTGTVAVALTIARLSYAQQSPVEINTPGGKLSVHFKRIDEGFSDIWLEGPAEMVFEGTVEL